MTAAKDMIPDDLRAFLSVESNLLLHWGSPYPVEVEEARFFGLDELSLGIFDLCTYEYYLNHNEPGEDPELCYEVSGIDLIREVEDYDSTGILIWFPQFSEYGAWDSDHAIVTMIPRVTWNDILLDSGAYVNLQWYPERVDHYLLRPWADGRCANLQPRKSGNSDDV